MRRPLAVFCFTWFAVQLAAAKLPQSATLAAAVFCLPVLLCMLLFPRLRRGAVLVCCAAVLCAAAVHLAAQQKVERLTAVFADGEPHVVTAEITQAVSGETGIFAQLRITEGNISFSTGAFLPQLYEVGDRLSVPLVFSASSARELAKGQALQAQPAGQAQIIGAADSLLYKAQRLQHALAGTLRAVVGGNAGRTAAAVCTGEKTGLTDSQYASYRKAGLAHLLAVSGMHLSVVCGAVMLCISPTRPKLRLLAGGMAIAGYAVLTGASFSVLRAGIMLAMVLAAPAVNRSADTATSLGFAAFCLTVKNPFSAADAGLLLSLCATAGVVAAIGAFETRWPRYKGQTIGVRLVRAAVQLAMVSLAATLATLPASLLTGTSVSVWSAPAGMLTVPVLGLVLGCGLPGAALLHLGLLRPLGRVLLAVCGLCCRWMDTVAGIFAKMPGGGYYLQGGYWAAAVAVICTGILAVFFCAEKKRMAAVVLLLCVFAALLGTALSANTVQAVLIGSAAQPAVVLVQNQKAAVLWRGGGRTDNLARALEHLNVRQVVLLCDFSGEDAARPVLPGCEPTAYCKVAKEVKAGVTFSPFDGIIIKIERQGKGDVCTVDAGGVRLGFSRGTPDVSDRQPFAVFFSGKTLPTGLSCDRLLTTSPAAAESAASSISYIKTGAGLCALIRPGVSCRITEVDTDGYS